MKALGTLALGVEVPLPARACDVACDHDHGLTRLLQGETLDINMPVFAMAIMPRDTQSTGLTVGARGELVVGAHLLTTQPCACTIHEYVNLLG